MTQASENIIVDLLVTQEEFDKKKRLHEIHQASVVGIMYHSIGAVLLVKNRYGGNITLTKEDYPELFL